MPISPFVPSSSTQVWYKLQGNSTDYSGNGNTGTDTSITYVPSLCRCFLGATTNTSYTSLITLTNQVTPTTISFCGYLREMHVGVSGKCIFRASSPDHTIQGNASDGKILIYDGTANRVGVNTWVLNKFVNYVFVYNGSGYNIYLNGKFLETINTSAQIQVKYIGRESGTNTFNGQILHTIFESRAWSPAEITVYSRRMSTRYQRKNWWAYLSGITIDILDTITTSESVTNLRNRLTSVSDTITTSETISALKTILINILDSVVTSETISYFRSFITTVIDTIATSDVLIAIRKLWIKEDAVSSTWTKESSVNTTWTKEN